MAADPIAAIPEAEATGDTAALFADIRATLGLPVVNLVWRHLATIPGGLPWTWDQVKPFYVSGAVERAAASFLAHQEMTAPFRPSPATLAAAGVTADDLPVIRAIIDSYHRGNAMNIIALNLPLSAASDSAPATLRPARLPVVADLAIPALPPLDGLPADHRQVVMELNAFGQRPGDPVVASMYRHLAPWPGLLALIAAMLAPVAGDGRLATLIAGANTQADAHAAALRAEGGQIDGRPAPNGVPAALTRFTGDVIARMVPICGMLRAALAAEGDQG